MNTIQNKRISLLPRAFTTVGYLLWLFDNHPFRKESSLTTHLYEQLKKDQKNWPKTFTVYEFIRFPTIQPIAVNWQGLLLFYQQIGSPLLCSIEHIPVGSRLGLISMRELTDCYLLAVRRGLPSPCLLTVARTLHSLCQYIDNQPSERNFCNYVSSYLLHQQASGHRPLYLSQQLAIMERFQNWYELSNSLDLLAKRGHLLDTTYFYAPLVASWQRTNSEGPQQAKCVPTDTVLTKKFEEEFGSIRYRSYLFGTLLKSGISPGQIATIKLGDIELPRRKYIRAYVKVGSYCIYNPEFAYEWESWSRQFGYRDRVRMNLLLFSPWEQFWPSVRIQLKAEKQSRLRDRLAAQIRGSVFSLPSYY